MAPYFTRKISGRSILDLALGWIDEPLNRVDTFGNGIDKNALWKSKRAIRLGLWYPSRCAWCIHKDPSAQDRFWHQSNLEKIYELADLYATGVNYFGQEGFRRWMDRPLFSIGNRKPLELIRCVSWDCAPKEWDHAIAAWHRSLMKVYRLALNRILRHEWWRGQVVWREMESTRFSRTLFWLQYLSFTFREVDDWSWIVFPQPATCFNSVMEIIIPNELIFLPAANELPKGWNRIPPLQATQIFGSELFKSGILCFAVPFGCRSDLNKLISSIHSQSSLLFWNSKFIHWTWITRIKRISPFNWFKILRDFQLIINHLILLGSKISWFFFAKISPFSVEMVVKIKPCGTGISFCNWLKVQIKTAKYFFLSISISLLPSGLSLSNCLAKSSDTSFVINYQNFIFSLINFQDGTGKIIGN